IRKLSSQTPALYILFDIILNDRGTCLAEKPLIDRRVALEKLFRRLDGERVRLSPFTRSSVKAKAWLSRARGALDGVGAKRVDEPYRFGERAMAKVKLLRTADCVVGGFRYGAGSRKVASLLLGLYNDNGLLDHVGFTSSIPDPGRLTAELERLRAA